MTPKKKFKAWMLSAFYEFQLYLKLNDLWWKGGNSRVKYFLVIDFSILHFVQCFDIHPAICKLYPCSFIYFVRINATFADFVSSYPLYAFAMFSRLVHLRTQAHTIRRGGHDLDKWRCLSVCRKVPWTHRPQGEGIPPLTKVHLSRCDPTPASSV